jgi:hypothetical protein
MVRGRSSVNCNLLVPCCLTKAVERTAVALFPSTPERQFETALCAFNQAMQGTAR